MQSIFPKENADKALKYRLYRHLPAYEKIIRNLVSFYVKSKGWYHSTIVTAGKKGALKYCAHSNSRRDYKYSLLTKNNAEKYRIIHFK